MTRDELDKALPKVVQRLRDALEMECVYLYGSAAASPEGPCNDLDVLVVIPKSDLNFFDRTAVAYRAHRRIGVTVDVQLYTREEFDSRSALPVSFERTVRNKGKIVYAA